MASARPSPGRGCGRGAAARRRASPSQGPISSICGARLGDGAEAQRAAELLGDAGEHPQVGQRARVGEARPRTAAGRPSQVTKVPALSLTGATGKTTSAARVTSVSRSSSETTNDAAASAAAEGGRVRGVVGVDAADDQAAELAGEPRRPRSRRRRGRRRRAALSTPQAAAASTRAAGSATGRPPGSRLGQAAGLDRAAVTGPARDPGQPGAGLGGQRGGGREGAGRGREALAERGPRRCCRCRSRPGRPGRSSAAASSPGAVATSWPSSLCSPRVVKGATERPGCRRRGRLAQPQEDRAGLVLGLEPDQHDGRRRSRGRRRSPRRPRDRSARPSGPGTSASSAECGRARKSMSLVPSADPGEPAVGVGVLGGEPAAGQHRRRRRRRRARGRRRRRPRARTPGAASRPRRGPAGR